MLASITLTLNNTVATIVEIGAVLAAITAIWQVLRPVNRVIRSLIRMAENFDGSDDCVLNQLRSITDNQAEFKKYVHDFVHAVRGSLTRVEGKIGTIGADEVSALDSRESLNVQRRPLSYTTTASPLPNTPEA